MELNISTHKDMIIVEKGCLIMKIISHVYMLEISKCHAFQLLNLLLVLLEKLIDNLHSVFGLKLYGEQTAIFTYSKLLMN